MKKILGLDLGIASIGWAYIEEHPDDDTLNRIIDAGVRIIPLDTISEKDEFTKGGNVGTNVTRRQARGARRNLQRFKLRRSLLLDALREMDMVPDASLYRLPPQDLFALRERALYEQLSPKEIGRVFLHLNLRRGFKSNRKTDAKEESDYKEKIKAREDELANAHQTIGQRFSQGLATSSNYRVRQQIFNRSTYQEEFDRIWESQARFHPTILTDGRYRQIRDKVIYFQRPLKSQKGLVGECALEWYYAKEKVTGNMVVANERPKICRPKCAPKSSPLAQVCRIWENIHNITIVDEKGSQYVLSESEKQMIFGVLQDKKDLSANALIKLLKLSPNKYTADALIREKKLQGNLTRVRLLEVFQAAGIQRRDILSFAPTVEEVDAVNLETGEVFRRLQLRADFDQEPLYQLWHLIYATESEQDLVRLLQARYQFTEEQAQKVAEIAFNSEFTNKSSRAMRRLLPHLQTGKGYAEACRMAGYNHSNYQTKSENEARALYDNLELIPKNSLRNPVVEKILNQMIHLVNAILDNPNLGRPDEIRVELARELKQSAKERSKAFGRNNKRERDAKDIRASIAQLLKIQPERVTKVQIEKWRLWHEVGGVSLYTGQKTELSAFLKGEGVDVEHIIPKSRCFDDSFENKTICETRFNQEKDKQTARDFMENQPVSGLQSLDAYLQRVQDLERSGKSGGKEGEGVSRAKYQRLMMCASEIPQDFLARQLRESQYIAKKARQLLTDVCYHVHSTSGSVTDFLRHHWGWDEVIEHLRLPQFREAGMTQIIEVRKGTQKKEAIPNWHKRLDHRHHALDALVVACTKQAYIQRLNNLNQTFETLKGADRRDALRQHGQKSVLEAPPFSFAQVCQAIENILVSYKQGSKLATRSKNILPKGQVQYTLTPRFAMHKETIYGKIKKYDPKKVPLNGKIKLETIEQIVHPYQRALVEERLNAFGGDPKKAFKDLDKNPILYGKNNQKQLTAVTIWEECYVAKEVITEKSSSNKMNYIVDSAIKATVLQRAQEGSLKNLGENPIKVGQYPVKSVRIINPAENMIQLPRGYAKSDGNHHLALYRDATGKRIEHIVTEWDAFRRVRLGLPAIIKDPAAIGEQVSNAQDGYFPDDLSLPDPNWVFELSLQINDMVVFGLDPKEIDFTNKANRKKIGKHLYKVQRLSSGHYWFSHHLETEFSVEMSAKNLGASKQKSPISFDGVKVQLDRLGNIIRVG